MYIYKNVLIEVELHSELVIPQKERLNVFINFDFKKPIGHAVLRNALDGLYADFYLKENCDGSYPYISYDSVFNLVGISVGYSPNIDENIKPLSTTIA